MINSNATAPPAVAEPAQVEGGGVKTEPPPTPASSSPKFHGGSKVFKSGPLFLSSKGIGWTSWKKRWFILTQTSLVFYRSDPNAAPPKSGEVNLTLGGIDLNSSGSVVVKEDKKLITVLFSDGRDGRAFTLKAETLEDLFEWKAALEEALANAPTAATVMGQNGLFKNDQLNGADVSSEQSKDKQTPKSMVLGRPILLALEDIDGTPSFLEKALRFLEDHGVKTEGILRQAADVEDVKHRIHEYEKGKTDFLPDEDAHVIGDCVKYVLRELPSSPVPASCCKALLEACRAERSVRVNAMRSAICETFPEPNRLLLQRILMMMQTVASNKAVNRMSISAVAACMAPLLLRPLLAGDCDLDHDFDVGGDGSVQLLQAAAAANHAQAIVITLLEEYDNIFGDLAETHEPYTDSEESGSESEEITDDESFDEDDMTEGSEYEEDEYFENDSSQASSETEPGESKSIEKVSGSHSSGSASPQVDGVLEPSQNLSSGPLHASSRQRDSVEGTKADSNIQADYTESLGDDTSVLQASSELLHGASRSMRRPTVWGRASGKKKLSMECIDLPVDDEAAIQKLESYKTEIEGRISNETMANSALLDSLEIRKRELHERRLALQKDVERLQRQLHKEMELRKALETALRISQLPLSVSSLDEEMRVELEEMAQTEADVANLKKKADDLESKFDKQREQTCRIGHEINNQLNQNAGRHKSKERKMDGGLSTISSTSENSSRCKHESSLEKSDSERDKKRESPSSSNIQMSLNHQGDAVQNPKAAGGLAKGPEMGSMRHASLSRKSSSRTEEPNETRSIRHGSLSRKSSSRTEGTNSTTSALSKLTNRLFLKERRTQIASELQYLDKDGGQNSSSSQNPDQADLSERHHDPKGKSREHEQRERSGQHAEKTSRKAEGSQNLERGMSESFPNPDKPPSKSTARTFSR